MEKEKAEVSGILSCKLRESRDLEKQNQIY
jgi:hypothetical protein